MALMRPVSSTMNSSRSPSGLSGSFSAWHRIVSPFSTRPVDGPPFGYLKPHHAMLQDWELVRAWRQALLQAVYESQ